MPRAELLPRGSPAKSKTGRAPDAAKIRSSALALPFAFKETVWDAEYVPAVTQIVSPGFVRCTAAASVRSGLLSVPDAESLPFGEIQRSSAPGGFDIAPPVPVVLPPVALVPPTDVVPPAPSPPTDVVPPTPAPAEDVVPPTVAPPTPLVPPDIAVLPAAELPVPPSFVLAPPTPDTSSSGVESEPEHASTLIAEQQTIIERRSANACGDTNDGADMMGAPLFVFARRAYGSVRRFQRLPRSLFDSDGGVTLSTSTSDTRERSCIDRSREPDVLGPYVDRDGVAMMNGGGTHVVEIGRA